MEAGRAIELYDLGKVRGHADLLSFNLKALHLAPAEEVRGRSLLGIRLAFQAVLCREQLVFLFLAEVGVE